MDKINFQNGVTKVNADTFNTFQNNIETAISSTESTISTINSNVETKVSKDTTIADIALSSNISASNLATKLKIEMGKLMYPIGSIYMSISSTNPTNLFGGTWVAWGAGKVPVGIDSSQTEFSTVEKTGGEKTHILTVNEMPSHTHTTEKELWALQVSNGTQEFGSGKSLSTRVTLQNTGGGQAHNNLQPYITCYMWKRTA